MMASCCHPSGCAARRWRVQQGVLLLTVLLSERGVTVASKGGSRRRPSTNPAEAANRHSVEAAMNLVESVALMPHCGELADAAERFGLATAAGQRRAHDAVDCYEDAVELGNHHALFFMAQLQAQLGLARQASGTYGRFLRRPMSSSSGADGVSTQQNAAEAAFYGTAATSTSELWHRARYHLLQTTFAEMNSVFVGENRTRGNFSRVIDRLRAVQVKHPRRKGMATAMAVNRTSNEMTLVAPKTTEEEWRAAMESWRRPDASASLAKLSHLVQQIQHLVDAQKLPAAFATEGVPAIESVIRTGLCDTRAAFRCRPDSFARRTRDLVLGLVDRPLYYPPLPSSNAAHPTKNRGCGLGFSSANEEPCVRGEEDGVDWTSAEQAFVAAESKDGSDSASIGKVKIDGNVWTHSGVVVIDNFLSDNALATLTELGEDTTVFHDHRAGYIGGYARDGLADATLLSVAFELTQKMPRVFCGHWLEQAWAYKYHQGSHVAGAAENMQNKSGIGLHADPAAINVNFWVGGAQPPVARAGGGMIVHLREAPLHWSFNEFNSDPDGKLQAFLNGEDDHNTKTLPLEEEKVAVQRIRPAATVTVAHRPNRLVLFRSNLFHETDCLEFAPGYKSRRINFTLLFGIRGGHKKDLRELACAPLALQSTCES